MDQSKKKKRLKKSSDDTTARPLLAAALGEIGARRERGGSCSPPAAVEGARPGRPGRARQSPALAATWCLPRASATVVCLALTFEIETSPGTCGGVAREARGPAAARRLLPQRTAPATTRLPDLKTGNYHCAVVTSRVRRGPHEMRRLTRRTLAPFGHRPCKCDRKHSATHLLGASARLAVSPSDFTVPRRPRPVGLWFPSSRGSSQRRPRSRGAGRSSVAVSRFSGLGQAVGRSLAARA